MRIYVITVAAGKRLIGLGVAADPTVQEAARTHTLVIIAGTTNRYVVEALRDAWGDGETGLPPVFTRGMTIPPGAHAASGGPARDVVIHRGVWRTDATIFDVADTLQEGDLVLKGANALDLDRRRAAVLIGDHRSGTAGATVPLVSGRRVQLLCPVGVEKRVSGDLAELASRTNVPGSQGPRLMVLPGRAFTELDALETLCGVRASLVAAGGVLGAEGCSWIGVEGAPEQLLAADRLIRSVQAEPAYA